LSSELHRGWKEIKNLTSEHLLRKTSPHLVSISIQLGYRSILFSLVDKDDIIISRIKTIKTSHIMHGVEGNILGGDG
jgi:hypothetical protein